MGIQGLTKLLNDNAPNSVKETKFESYFGRKIAIDASNHIYQYLTVVGRIGDQLLTNEAGEVTSHLQGMFNRTVRMLEAGIQPVYVFDGKPPELKKATLAGRSDRKEDAEEALKLAQETGDAEEIEKQSKRTVKVTREMNEDCKKLLQLMGVPFVDAPSEAEAQCAAMAKAGLVYAVATEDMDALTFGAPRMVRHLMGSAKESPVEFDLPKALEGLDMDMEQFIDLCILCGCDYANNIRGIGPVRAVQLMQKHGKLETVLANLDPKKYPLPEPYPYKEARAMFQEPEIQPAESLPTFTWNKPDEEGIIDFLVKENNFSEDRVRKAVKKVIDNRSKAGQSRMESFFKVMPKPAGQGTSNAAKKEDKGAAKGGAKRKDGGGKEGKGADKAAPAGKKTKKSGVGGGKAK